MTTTLKTFCRFDLRTTDAEGARAFYREVLGHDRSVIWPLHEQALARGARPHWLGGIEVEDAEGAAAAFVQRGALRYGPSYVTPEGSQTAVLRDPGGALLALRTPPLQKSEAPSEVVWHVLNTNDSARAVANYGELFGWEFGSKVDLGVSGTFQQFAWRPGGATVGALGDLAGRPGVHPHWLFFFEVEGLDAAVEAVRGRGGVAIDSVVLPDGRRFVVCDDAQGAAFGLTANR